MAEIDKVKEIIGFLKVVFGIYVAIEVSLIAYAFQNFDTIDGFKMYLIIVSIIFVSIGIVRTNKKILSEIDKLEDL
jgi:hypothetical protein